jgi:hypothetical protein
MSADLPPRWAFVQVEREIAAYNGWEPNLLNVDVVMRNPQGWPTHHAWAAFIARKC